MPRPQSQKKRSAPEPPESDDDAAENFSESESEDDDNDGVAAYLEGGESDEDEAEAEWAALQAMRREGDDAVGDDDDDELDGDDDDDDDDDNKRPSSNFKSSSSGKQQQQHSSLLTSVSPGSRSQWNVAALSASLQSFTQRNLPWAERLDIVSSRPALSDKTLADDDLRREVAFYNLALEAVAAGRDGFRRVGMGFERPLDFFAEMVKSDEHMAKVKDRLIFEGKKITAFEQRKSAKEQSVRSKEEVEMRSKLKAKSKKDNLQKVQEWAKVAKGDRLKGIKDDDDERRFAAVGLRDDKGGDKNWKRVKANEKFGRGGPTGRFKQNLDKKELNDFSKYNPRGGSFAGGQKSSKTTGFQKKPGGSKGREGKRARDSKRQKR